MAAIAISKLRRDGGTQFRVDLHDDVVEEYAAALKRGDKFPAVVVFHDGTDHWLADGFHTVKAHETNKAKEVEADIRAGTQRDAVLYAATEANRSHGVRFSNEEKEKRVTAVLKDSEWVKWSDSEIARQCGVSQPFVGKLRKKVQPITVIGSKRIGRDGKERQVPGRKPKPEKPTDKPPAAPPSAPKAQVKTTPDRGASVASEEDSQALPDYEGPSTNIDKFASGKAAPDADDKPADLSEINRSLAEEDDEFNLAVQRDRAYARFVTMFHEWPKQYHSYLIESFDRAKEEIRS